MATYHLSGKSYELPETSKEFLESYLKRLRAYTRENKISESYLDDIIERINDKLTELEIGDAPIKNSDVIKIVNDIGEGEDIFPIDRESSTNNAVKEVFQRPLRRDTENGILFGVCAGIAKYFDLDALWIRLVFIALVFLGGTGIVLYLILAFLMPAEDKGEKILKNHSKNSTLKDGSLIEYVQTTANSGNQRGFIASVFLAIGKFDALVFRLLLKIILIVICFVLIGCFIAGVVVSGIILSGSFEIGNQQFLSNIPDTLSFAIPFLTVLCLVVTVALFGNVIARNLFGKGGWLMIAIGSAIGFICLATGSIQLVKDYTWTERKTEEITYAFSGKTLNIMNDLDGFNDESQRIGLHMGTTSSHMNIEKVKGIHTITVRSTIRIQTKDQATAKYILESRNPPLFSLSGTILSLKHPEGLDFKNKVPFAFPERTIRITIPEDVEIVGRYANRYYHDDESIPEAPEVPNAPETPGVPETPEVPEVPQK